MSVRALILLLLLSLAPRPAAAQEPLARGQIQSPVLTIDAERLLAETRFGRRLAEDIRERAEALAAENERLQRELTEEERSLTERRPSMEMEEFRAEADAFDQRVQGIRADQDAKQSALEAELEEGRRGFLNAVTPVLGGLMIDLGAAVIMERRDVFLSASLVDITDEAVVEIDAQLGDGSTPPLPPDAARDEPDLPAEPEDATPSEDRPEAGFPDAVRTPAGPAVQNEDD